jgi:hypothetical protein
VRRSTSMDVMSSTVPSLNDKTNAIELKSVPVFRHFVYFSDVQRLPGTFVWLRL